MNSRRMLGSEVINTLFTEAGPGIAVSAFASGVLLNGVQRGMVAVDTQALITSDTAFHVASVSKQFTAYAIAQLVIEGRLRLDDNIGLYLPFINEAAAGITIDQLLFHTSGLSDQWVLLNLGGWNDRDLITTRDINGLTNRQRALKYQPGVAFSYTNTGYTLLAEIVEIVVDRSLDDYLQSVLFRPSRMIHSRFRADPDTKTAFEAECYSRKGGGFINTTPRFSTVGATSLQTSIADLARWAPHITDVDDATGRMMRGRGALASGQTVPYGFGLYHGSLGKIVTLSHSGWDADFSSYVVFLPELGIGSAVLSNGSRINLELIALSFLSEFVDLGYVGDEIEKRLTAMIRSFGRLPVSTRLERQQEVFGFLESGDFRVWKHDEYGHRLLSGGIQSAEPIADESYMLGASLTTLDFDNDALVISSPTQSQRVTLPRLPRSYERHAFNGNFTFFSDELNVTHRLFESEGKMSWLRPGQPPCLLEEIGTALFFCDGFTLLVLEDALTIFNARSAPIRFARV